MLHFENLIRKFKKDPPEPLQAHEVSNWYFSFWVLEAILYDSKICFKEDSQQSNLAGIKSLNLFCISCDLFSVQGTLNIVWKLSIAAQNELLFQKFKLLYLCWLSSEPVAFIIVGTAWYRMRSIHNCLLSYKTVIFILHQSASIEHSFFSLHKHTQKRKSICTELTLNKKLFAVNELGNVIKLVTFARKIMFFTWSYKNPWRKQMRKSSNL